MEARRFNSITSGLNSAWASHVLGMEINSQIGPDLVDDFKNVELKFCLTGELCGAEKYTKGWTVLEYQMRYNENKPAFWGLGLYEIDRPVSGVQSVNQEDLEAMVLKRILWLVQWDWMNGFSPHETRGKTRISSWENTLRYPKLKHLPGTTETYKVRKGLIHLTQGVDPVYFSFLNEHL